MRTIAAVNARVPAAVVMRGAANMPQPTEVRNLGTTQVLGKGEQVFAEGDAAEFFYKVVDNDNTDNNLLVTSTYDRRLTSNPRFSTGGLYYERQILRDWFARRFPEPAGRG